MALKFKVLQNVRLDISGDYENYSPEDKQTIFEVPYATAVENSYFERFLKYPEHIEIISFEEDVKKEVKETKKKK